MTTSKRLREIERRVEALRELVDMPSAIGITLGMKAEMGVEVASAARAIARELDIELQEAVRLLRDVWTTDPDCEAELTEQAIEVDAFLARHKEADDA